MEGPKFPIELDKSKASAVLKQFTGELRQATKTELTDAEIAEKAKVLAAQRALRQKIQEAAKAHKTEVDLAKEAADAKAKAERQAAQVAIKAAKESAAAAKLAARESSAAQKQAADTKAKADREAARAAVAAAKESAAAAKEAARQQEIASKDAERQAVRSAKERERAEKEAYAEAVRRAKEATRIEKLMAQEAQKSATKTEGLLGSLMNLSSAMIGLNSVGQMFTAITDHFDKLRVDAYHAAEDVLRMRGAIRELAALRGDLGKTGETVAHVLGISAETLQTPEEAQQMEAAGLGIGELAIGKNISKEEFNKALISAGKMQTLEGGPAEGYGAMMGQLALSAKGPVTAADLEGKLQRMFAIQQPGGFKNFGQAAAQYAKIQPLIQSGVLSEEQAMGLLSTMSVAAPEEAATMTEQFVRATMSGRLRERGMKVPEGVETEKSAEYMKSIGADKISDPVEIGKRIAADLKRKQAAAAAQGGKFDQYGYLQTHGFVNQQDIQTVMLMAGMENAGTTAKIHEAETAPLEAGAISKRFEERRSTDLLLQGRAGQISERLAGVKQGMKEEPLVAAQRAAFARLKAQGKISGTFEEWQGTGATMAAIQDINPFALNYHSQVNRETMRALEEERRRVGGDKPTMAEAGGGAQDYMRRFARNVREAGGDVTAGVSDDLKQAAKDLREAARDFNDARKGKPLNAPPALPVAARQ